MESNRDRFPETRAIVWGLQSNRDGVPELCAMNHGVGAEGVLAAQSALTGEGEFGNDGRVEQLWALKAIGRDALDSFESLLTEWYLTP